MTPPIYRRIVYTIFIIIFLITAPAIILYTQGYRYNFKYSRIQKTGILILSSIPRQAEISLNGQVYEADTTPAKIENLLPGDYEIKLIKENYHNWQKKLPIFENNTTFAEKIILWKNSQPVMLEKNIAQNWLLAPNQTKLVGTNNNQLLSFDLNNESFSVIDEIKNSSSTILSWSNTSKKIIIKTNNTRENYFIYNVELGNNKQPITNQNYTDLKWDLENDNIVYGLNKSGIWEIDLFSQNQKLISALPNIDDFVVLNNNIHLLSDNKIYLQEKNNPNLKLVEEIKCNNCKFINRKNDNLLLLDPADKKLFIINQENKKTTLALEAKAVVWLDDQTMLFYNDWEIWIYNLAEKEPELITRFGQPIQSALWHPESRHIIFVLDNKIKIIELDNRELRNVITLAEVNTIKNITIDSAGKNLFFTGDYFNLKGLFKLNIR